MDLGTGEVAALADLPRVTMASYYGALSLKVNKAFVSPGRQYGSFRFASPYNE